ncbi:hypothetical protein SAMN05192534_106115 [Alteribacillus persepolensis]|uniref:Prepilin-type N-terminal cleavage/methylation domain-containing protein n=1 Tax=Alteribacillus persepolensis TaxID=568899 RepID=A0A1G8CWW9_9BACI|nr:type II secretion system protein [Alteribacillus persepolensis]SDH50027.1 hypothetical protein SAMN05192534_106115 [Alteribacillus persepolensis]
MKSDERGMTLIESIAALGLLMFSVSALLPLLFVLQTEQQTLMQERKALHLLEKSALIVQTHGNDENLRNSGPFEVHTTKTGEGLDICVEWKGENSRSYDKCMYVLP